jgi:hypothetical protein
MKLGDVIRSNSAITLSAIAERLQNDLRNNRWCTELCSDTSELGSLVSARRRSKQSNQASRETAEIISPVFSSAYQMKALLSRYAAREMLLQAYNPLRIKEHGRNSDPFSDYDRLVRKLDESIRLDNSFPIIDVACDPNGLAMSLQGAQPANGVFGTKRCPDQSVTV